MSAVKTTEIIRVYWRDNANPFPGRLVEVKRRKLSRDEKAWLRFIRDWHEAEIERAIAQRDALAIQFEKLADAACEEGS